MVKNKPITLSFVDKKVKELNKMEKYYIDADNVDFINYYPKFANDKIEKLLMQLAESVKYCRDNNLEFLKSDVDIIKYTSFLIIKHFTSLNNELEDKSFEVHVDTLDKLHKSGLYELFIEDMFDELEIQKVIDKLTNITNLHKKHTDDINSKREFIENNVQNEELKKKALDSLN